VFSTERDIKCSVANFVEGVIEKKIKDKACNSNYKCFVSVIRITWTFIENGAGMPLRE
jgi:hypothetical protein